MSREVTYETTEDTGITHPEVRMHIAAIQPPYCYFCKEDANNTLTVQVTVYRKQNKNIHLCYQCTMTLANTLGAR